jgi:glycosyltransferase involved in cell wall biosynthesis
MERKGLPFSPMRLAILQQSYGRFGGAERLALSHYMEMRRMGRDVTFYYTGTMSQGWKERLEGEPIRNIPTAIVNRPKRMRLLFKFLEELKQYDKIIVHHHIEPVLASYLSKILGPRIVWYSGSVFELAWEEIITGVDYRRISPTVRRTGGEYYGGLLAKMLLSDPLYGVTARVAKVVDVETVRGYGKVIANSLFLSRFLERVYRLGETPSVVYPAADPLLEQLASKNNAQEEDYMLVVGSLIPLKNVESMIRAAAYVRSSKIMVIGDGQEMSNLKDLGFKLDVPMEFRGTMNREEDLAEAYGGCKFLVHLSLYEPFGLTPLEAGLFSKPSIVTNHGGPPEVVVDGVTGYIVDPLDHRFIGSKMNALLDDNTLRHDMGKRARENMVKKFTLERSASKLLEEVEK